MKSKKTATLLVVFMFCIGVLMIYVSASASDVIIIEGEKNGFRYEIYNNEAVTILSYKGSEQDVIIPSEIDGYPVKGILNGAFCNRMMLESVVIPDSVVDIGGNAFYYCGRLASVVVGDGVTKIGYGAFEGCSSLKNVTLGKNLTSIGDRVFGGCCALKSIVIPDSVTEMGSYVFRQCLALESVNIPKGMKKIGGGTFESCRSLECIIIPENITIILEDAFLKCRSLANIEVSEGNKTFCDVDGVLFNKNKTVLCHYPEGRTDTGYFIPESVRGIAASAFYNSKLTSIDIPDNVVNIRMNAFEHSELLTSVIISDSVKYIEYAVFADCPSLTKVVIPRTSTSIDYDAFKGSHNITLYVENESFAHTCASNRNIPFVVMDAVAVDKNSGYKVEREIGVLSGIGSNTNLETLESNLLNGEFIVIKDSKGEAITDENTLVGTGTIIEITLEDGNIVDKVSVAVMGDTNGDAYINSRDIAMLQKHVMEIKKLEGAFFYAADCTMDEFLNSRDIAQVQKLLVS